MNILFTIIGFACILLNCYATYSITNNSSNTTERKALQLIMVWLVPIVGALVCIVFERSDKLATAVAKPQEFCENTDSSGSDH
jgi:hypothetical protein